MGGILSGKKEQPTERASRTHNVAHSHVVQLKLTKAREEKKKVIKLLLLGTAGSGKTTVLKQMKLLKADGFSDDDRKEFVKIIRKNIAVALTKLIKMTRRSIVNGKEIAENEALLELSQEVNDKLNTTFDDAPVKGKAIAEVWSKARTQYGPDGPGSELELNDIHFLDKTEEVFSDSFIPSNDDILRARQSTETITEFSFKDEIKNMTITFTDVGGQRALRSRWIGCFEDVTAILFICSLSDYNQTLEECPDRNCLDESTAVFQAMSLLSYFESAPIFLFLNKHDAFLKKVVVKDIAEHHKEYTGGLDADEGLKFIRSKFMTMVKKKKRNIFTHVTTATNTENIEFVWGAVQHVVFTNTLKSAGLAL